MESFEAADVQECPYHRWGACSRVSDVVPRVARLGEDVRLSSRITKIHMGIEFTRRQVWLD